MSDRAHRAGVGVGWGGGGAEITTTRCSISKALRIKHTTDALALGTKRTTHEGKGQCEGRREQIEMRTSRPCLAQNLGDGSLRALQLDAGAVGVLYVLVLILLLGLTQATRQDGTSAPKKADCTAPHRAQKNTPRSNTTLERQTEDTEISLTMFMCVSFFFLPVSCQTATRPHNLNEADENGTASSTVLEFVGEKCANQNELRLPR